MPEVIAVGAVTVDLNIEFSDEKLRALSIEPGTCTQVDEQRIEEVRAALELELGLLPKPLSGGALANAADLIARSKTECGFFGMGGDDDFGRHFRTDCEKSGLQYLYPLQPGLVTGYNLCFFNLSGTSTIFWTAGSNNAITPSIFDSKTLTDAELVLLDGFAFGFGEHGPDTIFHVASLAKEQNVPYVLTLASVQAIETYRAAFLELLPDASLVVGNLSQAAALSCTPNEESLERVASNLKQQTKNFIITLGSDGAYAFIKGEEYRIQALPVNAKDTTGAGDAFLGGFLAASQRGSSIENALNAGRLFAAEVVQHEGARILPSTDLENLLKVSN